MKNRVVAALGAALLGAWSIGLAVVHAALPLTPTVLGTGYPTPIGIDWLSPSNQLLISDNWNTGVPKNFETVNRVSGAHAVWGSQAGFTDEIYFATVRPGQPGGWVVGDVFSSKGAGDTVQLAHFDQIGAPVGGGNFATLTGETRLKRGGVTFDRFGVPGLDGDLVVVASNDVGAGNTAGVWKVNSSGTATKITELSAHAEGVAVIPNNPAYGPWAGKILVGEEGTLPSPVVEAIDPATGTHTTYDVGGVRVEDIWVIPADSDFYGVDTAEGGASKIWTIPASDWSSNGLVGKVLLAQEHQASLYTAAWNGVSFVITPVLPFNGQGPLQWEHITFAPVAPPPSPHAKISIAANATNEVGQPHTFTVTLEKDPTGTFTFVPAANEHVDVTLTDSNGAVHASPTGTCTNAGPNTDVNGQCTITFTSNSAGKVTGHATSTLTVSGSSLHVETDGVAPNSGNAVKTFVDANIQITPQTATNPINTNHVLTGHVNVNAGGGAGYVNAPDTTLITFSLTNLGGATASFVGPNSCTTTGGTGSCNVTISSPTAGSTTIKAITDVAVGGVSLHRETGDSHPGDSPDAKKDWITSGKSITIGPSSMEGAIKISAGDWVNGGYSFKTDFTGNITITADVTITGKCIGGSLTQDTLIVPLGTVSYAAEAGSNWKPTGDANSVLSWQGSIVAPATLCGGSGGKLDASKGAVFHATIAGTPPGGLVTFRFKFRDPASKGKPNTNCLDTSDPNRNKADVCGASWSETKKDP